MHHSRAELLVRCHGLLAKLLRCTFRKIYSVADDQHIDILRIFPKQFIPHIAPHNVHFHMQGISKSADDTKLRGLNLNMSFLPAHTTATR